MFDGNSSLKLSPPRDNSTSPLKYPESGAKNSHSSVLHIKIEKPQQPTGAIPNENIAIKKSSPPRLLDLPFNQQGISSPKPQIFAHGQGKNNFVPNYFAKGVPTVAPDNRKQPNLPVAKPDTVIMNNELEIRDSIRHFDQGENQPILRNPNRFPREKHGSISTLPHQMPVTGAPVIKKVTNKDILDNINNIIERLIPLVDFNKVINKRAEIESFIENTKSSSYSSKNQFSQIFQHLKCSRCTSPKPMIELSCKHLFCEDCTLHLKVSIKAEINRTFLSCSICNQELTQAESSFLLKDRRVSIEKNSFIESLNRDRCLHCFKCAEKRLYFDTDTCMHMCKDCIADNIRDSKITCDVCETEFTSIEKIINEKIFCGGCKETKYFVGDRLKIIHKDRCTLCASCLNITLNQGQCRCCNAKLSRLEKLEINQHLFEFCQSCNSEMYRGELNKCGNCKVEICNECLSRTGRNCSNCGSYMNSE